MRPAYSNQTLCYFRYAALAELVIQQCLSVVVITYHAYQAHNNMLVVLKMHYTGCKSPVLILYASYKGANFNFEIQPLRETCGGVVLERLVFGDYSGSSRPRVVATNLASPSNTPCNVASHCR
jgi:hypothetical protein